MPKRHYPPAYLRYLRARLWNLGRPGFWVTAIFLSVVGLVTWEYWSNPDIFVYKQKKQVASQKPADSYLSEENKAIAADIDNLPALFNDFDEAVPLTTNNPKENADKKNSKGLLDDLINKQKSLSDNKSKSGLGIVNPELPPPIKNPFVAQTENLLRAGIADSNSEFIGFNSSFSGASDTENEETSSGLGIGLTNQTNKNQNSVSISPLQAALNESTNQNLSGFNRINANQPNTLGRVSNGGTTPILPLNGLSSQIPTTGLNPGTGYIPTTTNLQANPYSTLNGIQSPVTPSVNSVAPYSSQSPNQTVVPPTNSTGYRNYGLQPPTQVPQSTYGNYGLQPPTQVPQSTYGNYGLQQPTQVPQSTYGNYGLQQPTQVPQSTYGNYGSQQPVTRPNSTASYLLDILEKRRGQNQR
ncbi:MULTISPECIES: hypothetical protein [Nostoc]|uniref:Uncharacterized protein n=1 Tax=Nostoc paludosum FACHB-159 TaxID=2692908 RepID=A0ABR8K6M2_9NOSO|nr:MULTISPECIES: hypothetical protein [Nostoc]MBD2676647.1 hypothetical protein [Nostoc sp. FACHB-857]MBD2735126.1 hypothetical protein [Nostoc paludosum FACHB-159]